MEHQSDLDALAHHDSPRLPLSDRAHDQLQRQIDALLTHARTVTQQIADIVHRQQRIDSQMTNADSRIQDLQTEFRRHAKDNDARSDRIEARVTALDNGQTTLISALAANTAVTNQIKDILTTGRGVSAAVKWVGGMAVAVAAVWTLLAMAGVAPGGFGVGP